MRRSHEPYEDDGRTIADMSGVSFPAAPDFSRPPKPEAGPAAGEPRPERPWEDRTFSREERRAVVFGALKATLLIAAAFLLGLGAVTWLLLALWT